MLQLAENEAKEYFAVVENGSIRSANSDKDVNSIPEEPEQEEAVSKKVVERPKSTAGSIKDSSSSRSVASSLKEAMKSAASSLKDSRSSLKSSNSSLKNLNSSAKNSASSLRVPKPVSPKGSSSSASSSRETANSKGTSSGDNTKETIMAEHSDDEDVKKEDENTKKEQPATPTIEIEPENSTEDEQPAKEDPPKKESPPTKKPGYKEFAPIHQRKPVEKDLFEVSQIEIDNTFVYGHQVPKSPGLPEEEKDIIEVADSVYELELDNETDEREEDKSTKTEVEVEQPSREPEVPKHEEDNEDKHYCCQ
ncbi:hypothetical protein BJ508DRAFT_170940 [Ascobolus immersus RN42]|uniref:Uncharacterized protein n=1 Tax=Ascobolus immersus RN42 TaxID=1160509 RepID=A0A3N4HXX1_ASCIM|nr:hypothetical protein BJ508DRAFT_170940 [Ascobolus immersus RN42]